MDLNTPSTNAQDYIQGSSKDWDELYTLPADKRLNFGKQALENLKECKHPGLLAKLHWIALEATLEIAKVEEAPTTHAAKEAIRYACGAVKTIDLLGQHRAAADFIHANEAVAQALKKTQPELYAELQARHAADVDRLSNLALNK